MQLPKAIEEMQAGIEALNLDPIKIKLLDPTENPKAWTREYIDQLEIAYKRFLFLSVKYPEMPTVPTKDIDMFWHYHILDTMKYAEDCQNTFGFFLHHFPYLGMRGEEDANNLKEASISTYQLYEQEFGESMSVPKPAKCATAIVEPAKCVAVIAESAKCATAIVEPAKCATAIVEPAKCATAIVEPAKCATAIVEPAKCATAIVEPAKCSAVALDSWKFRNDVLKVTNRPAFA